MSAQDPLDLDLDEMRRFGYQAVDMLVEWAAQRETAPAVRRASREEMRLRLEEPAPETRREFADVLTRLEQSVLPFMSRLDHPGYFAYIPGFGTWPAALGDFIASACNIYGGSWYESAGPSQVELTVLDWFKSWVGYPNTASGILLSGGSAANMSALACAREARAGAMSPDLVVYVSDQAHSSMARAARVLGFRPDQVRVLPVDDRFRMRPDALEAAIHRDLAEGRRPLLVSASAGSTNTGSIDPLPEIAALCRERDLWFHADAAYGAFAVLTERGREWLAGLDLADSITLDPHKWLYQPFECGCLLVRDGLLLREAFQIEPDYLSDAAATAAEVNFSDLGMQLTRMSRALKVWMSIQCFGLDAFRTTIDRCLDLARHAQQRVEASNRLQLLLPPALGIVCFRRMFDGLIDEESIADANSRLVSGLVDSGLGIVSSTKLHGRYAIRMCVLNHTSTQTDVDRVLDWIESAPMPARSRRPPEYDRHPSVGQRRAAQQDLPGRQRERPPLLASLPPDVLLQVEQAAVERRLEAGQAIVEQWEVSSDFFVILEGEVEVRTAAAVRALLGAGDFFGELAALDWGAGFGYPRLATVRAASHVSLLVVPGEAFRRLMHECPPFAEQIRDAVRERLPGL